MPGRADRRPERDRCTWLRAESRGARLARRSNHRHPHRSFGAEAGSPLHIALRHAEPRLCRYTALGRSPGHRRTRLINQPDDAELIRAYAYALQSVGEYDDATSYLERSIELRPSYLPTHFELAALYLARDQDQRAIDLYDRILSLDPRHARAMLRQCLAYRKVGQFARALGFCEDSVANDDSDSEALFHLALLYYRERRFEASRDTFQRCLDYDDGSYDLSCRYRLGLSHYYLGDCAAGWALLNESLAIAQAQSGYESTIANILLGLEDIAHDSDCIDSASAPVSIQD